MPSELQVILFPTCWMLTLTGAEKYRVNLWLFNVTLQLLHILEVGINLLKYRALKRKENPPKPQICHTVHFEVDKWILFCINGADVAAVSALVLNLHPCQLEWGVSFGELVLEQRCPASELLVLGSELVFVAIVQVYKRMSLWQVHPVDVYSSSVSLESAR